MLSRLPFVFIRSIREIRVQKIPASCAIYVKYFVPLSRRIKESPDPRLMPSVPKTTKDRCLIPLYLYL